MIIVYRASNSHRSIHKKLWKYLFLACVASWSPWPAMRKSRKRRTLMMSSCSTSSSCLRFESFVMLLILLLRCVQLANCSTMFWYIFCEKDLYISHLQLKSKMVITPYNCFFCNRSLLYYGIFNMLVISVFLSIARIENNLLILLRSSLWDAVACTW